jgi:hypothetical protein
VRVCACATHVRRRHRFFCQMPLTCAHRAFAREAILCSFAGSLSSLSNSIQVRAAGAVIVIAGQHREVKTGSPASRKVPTVLAASCPIQRMQLRAKPGSTKRNRPPNLIATLSESAKRMSLRLHRMMPTSEVNVGGKRGDMHALVTGPRGVWRQSPSSQVWP